MLLIVIVCFICSYGKDKSVLYPPPDKIVEYANKIRESSKEKLIEEESVPEPENKAAMIEQLQALANRDPMHELHEQEAKSLWSSREFCMRNVPTLLAKLLQCVEWNDHRYEIKHVFTKKCYKIQNPVIKNEKLNFVKKFYCNFQ